MSEGGSPGSPGSPADTAGLAEGDPLALPDLASRTLRGSVIAASDEFFAEKENLIKPSAPVHSPHTFGNKGQVYDGWETRRRRRPGDWLVPSGTACDWVIVRLGAPGVIHAVVVDTAFFTGNFPPSCSVEACCVTGYPQAPELDGERWTEIVPRSPLEGDAQHVLAVRSRRRFTHVRLKIYPDGGVARLRVHGVVVPDPALLEGITFDLAALENGGDVTGCSDRFFSSPRNAISPGLSRVMGEGWETRRRREPGSEWLTVRLAQRAVIAVAEIDTSGYVGNAPGAAALLGYDEQRAAEGWFGLMPRTPLLPDTPHRFRMAAGMPVTSVRLDVFPDGGIARLRLRGSLTPDGLAAARRRWEQTALPGCPFLEEHHVLEARGS